MTTVDAPPRATLWPRLFPQVALFVAVGPPTGYLVYAPLVALLNLKYHSNLRDNVIDIARAIEFPVGVILSYIAGLIPAAIAGALFALADHFLPPTRAVRTALAALFGFLASAPFVGGGIPIPGSEPFKFGFILSGGVAAIASALAADYLGLTQKGDAA